MTGQGWNQGLKFISKVQRAVYRSNFWTWIWTSTSIWIFDIPENKKDRDLPHILFRGRKKKMRSLTHRAFFSRFGAQFSSKARFDSAGSTVNRERKVAKLINFRTLPFVAFMRQGIGRIERRESSTSARQHLLALLRVLF